MSYIAKNGRLYTSGASEALTLLDDKFSVNKSYSKGDSCIYNDYLWKFTSDKPAGEWDSSVVEQCRVMDFVNDVNNDLTQSIDSIQSQIVPTASIESGETASKAYSVGDFLVKDGILYKVTKAIAEGDALTMECIAQTTVVTELNTSNFNYFPLHGASYDTIVASPTIKTYTVYNSRNFSNYKILIFAIVNKNLIRISSIVPYELFNNIGINLSYVDSANTERWVEIKYVSNTSFSVNASKNINNDTYVTIYGLL